MDIKKMALALGLDPEKATAEQVLEAATKAGKDLSAFAEKVKAFEGLSAVKPEELKAHGLEVKDGKVVKLSAAPAGDETPKEKALREENESLKKAASLSRLKGVKAEIEQLAATKLPPAASEAQAALHELSAIEGEMTALCLSADGESVQKKGVNVLSRVMTILKGLPDVTKTLLSQHGSGGAHGGQDAKKAAEEAEKEAEESLARVRPGSAKK